MGVTVVKQAGRVTVVRETTASPAVTVSPREVQVTPGVDSQIEVTRSQRDIDITRSSRTVEVVSGGIQGPPGLSGDTHYRHVQGAPSAEWVVDHNLGKFPAVSIVDSAGSEVVGSVNHVNQERVILTFTAAFAGEAFFN